MMTQQDLLDRTLSLIASDQERMTCLRLVAELNLPQAAIAAGFVRNAIWDARFGAHSCLSDIDVVYFEPNDLDPQKDEALERRLDEKRRLPWQVRNQARMHLRNEVRPYTSMVDAVSRFPEMATCLSVSLDPQGCLSMPNTEGLTDAWLGVLRPNPLVPDAAKIVVHRVLAKRWAVTWPGLELKV